MTFARPPPQCSKHSTGCRGTAYDGTVDQDLPCRVQEGIQGEDSSEDDSLAKAAQAGIAGSHSTEEYSHAKAQAGITGELSTKVDSHAKAQADITGDLSTKEVDSHAKALAAITGDHSTEEDSHAKTHEGITRRKSDARLPKKYPANAFDTDQEDEDKGHQEHLHCGPELTSSGDASDHPPPGLLENQCAEYLLKKNTTKDQTVTGGKKIC